MKSPTIFLIAPTHYVLGGIAVWVSYILRGLASNGFIVTFGALDGRYHNADKYLDAYRIERYVKIDADVGSNYAKRRAIQSAIELVDPDVVLVANVADVYPAVREMRQKGDYHFKVVPTLHGVIATLFHDMRRYSDVIDDIVVTNRLTQRMANSFTGLSDMNVHYAQYGVPVAQDVQSDLRNDVCTILYCGRIDEQQKRCQDLPVLCANLLDLEFKFKLLIVGDGPTKSALLLELLELEERYGIKDFYEYIPSVPADEMYQIAYCRADVLFLPSLWETGPIVVWEAMSYSIPVVTSNYVGSKSEGSLVHNENCLMFEIGDMRCAANVVIESQQESTRKKIVLNGLNLVNTRYTREASIEAWAKVLREIISTRLAVPDKAEFVRCGYHPDGRLEKVFGSGLAAWIRKLFRHPVHFDSPGDEWPHAHSRPTLSEIDQFDNSLIDLENRLVGMNVTQNEEV